MTASSSRPLNLILATLPELEYQRLVPDLTIVDLPLEKVLYETLDEVKTVYFPNTAIISLVSVLENGSTTEVGIVGRNGFFGHSVILGGNRSHNRAIVQMPGSLVKIPADIVKREFARGGKFQELLLLSIEYGIRQVSQLAVCNRHHTIEQRLARWLLQVRGLVRSEELHLTQDFLAKMLGVRRAGVTIAAQKLQKLGAISYSRGKIIILDLQSLENASCECYKFQKTEFHRLFSSELRISNIKA